MRPGIEVTPARLAPSGFAVQPRDAVINIGCDHGADPTVRTSHVTTVNKFLGPANIQVAGQPVQGRSGGGLFTIDGQVIGVCNAADPADNEGLYAALGTIHGELTRLGLANVLATAPTVASAADRSTSPQMAASMPAVDQRSPLGQVLSDSVPASSSAALTSQESLALEEIRRKTQGAEVICIVRSLADPRQERDHRARQSLAGVSGKPGGRSHEAGVATAHVAGRQNSKNRRAPASHQSGAGNSNHPAPPGWMPRSATSHLKLTSATASFVSTSETPTIRRGRETRPGARFERLPWRRRQPPMFIRQPASVETTRSASVLDEARLVVDHRAADAADSGPRTSRRSRSTRRSAPAARSASPCTRRSSRSGSSASPRPRRWQAM